MEKNSTYAWTFENSTCVSWLVLSWLIPCWGLCLPSLTVSTGLQQFVLALAVTTKTNPTRFLYLPTDSYPSTSSSLVALDMLWGHVLVGDRPPIHVETYLYFLLLWVCFSLDHFFHPVDCEAAGILGAVPAKEQVRDRSERCWLGWVCSRSLWNCGFNVFLPEASPC